MNSGVAGTRAEAIAIVGIGCRLPGDVSTPDAFWQLLMEGRDAVGEVPEDRWLLSTYYDAEPGRRGKVITRRGGFVGDLDSFDAAAFGISPREAEMMDPQQRLLLEVAWEAFEDAGIVPSSLAGSKTGVFVGISNVDYSVLQSRDPRSANAHSGTGIALSIAANRISYVFDFHGPSMAVDTACSSSLVALHLACQSLLSGESTVALAGGVNRMFDPSVVVGFSLASMLAPDGRCKTFDAKADGFVRAEGSGLFVLKTLSRAQADNDRIYALVRGTGTNQDGHTVGIALPSGDAQEALIREVYDRARVAPRDVGYVEAHGTGTAVGDPIEATAIGSVLSDGRRSGERCLIGSVKTNLGHLEPAAGIAGAIKVALSLRHGVIPGQLHFETPNPKIDFEALKLQVVTSAVPWRGALPWRAGVNSFGFGGTNAHVLLEAVAPEARVIANATPRAHAVLLPLSAKSAASLAVLASRLRAALGSADDSSPTFEDLVYTATHRRGHYAFRTAFIARSREDLANELDAFIAAAVSSKTPVATRAATKKPRTVFVCSGMGPQWWGMARELLREPGPFRAAVERCDAAFTQLSGWSLVDAMMANEGASEMHRTKVAQPTNFALQVGLAALLESWGITPDAIVGHSAGEVAAIYLAGAMTLEEAVRVVYHRSRLQELAAGEGRMAAAGLHVDEVGEVLGDDAAHVTIAAVNTRSLVSLAGDEAVLASIGRRVEAKGRYWKVLFGDVPFHSPKMDRLEAPLRESLGRVACTKATIPLASTVTGGFVQGPELDADYWWRNIREPVRFADAIACLAKDRYDTFIELAPHPVLASAIAEEVQARGDAALVVAMLRRKENAFSTALGALRRLYVAGYDVRWDAVSGSQGTLATFPVYPWQRERFWKEGTQARSKRLGFYAHPLAGRSTPSPVPTWECELDLGRLPFLHDHRVQHIAVIPGSAYVEMALFASREQEQQSTVVESIELLRPIVLDERDGVALAISLETTAKSFTIHSRPLDGDAPWVPHAVGSYRPMNTDEAPERECIQTLLGRTTHELLAEDCYPIFERYGLSYGPAFRGIERIHFLGGDVVAKIRLPESAGAAASFILHPALLDACFQSAICAVFSDAVSTLGHDDAFVVGGIGAVSVYAPVGGEVWSHTRIVELSATRITANVRLLDLEGRVVAEVKDLYCRTLAGETKDATLPVQDLFYEPRWRQLPLDPASSPLSAAFIPSPLALANELASDVAQLVKALDRDRHYDDFNTAQERLVRCIVRQLLTGLGVATEEGARVTLDEVAERANVADDYRRLLQLLFELARERGLLERDGAAWRVTESSSDATDTQDAWTPLLRDFPDYRAEWTLLRRVEDGLVKVLRGELDAVELMFKGGQLAGAENFYQDSQTFHVYNSLARAVVAHVVRSVPEGRALRVLEVGAGSGGTTTHLLPVLPPAATEYAFTDVSRVFLGEAEEKFADYPFVSYKTLDVERDPVEQGFALGSFDVIVASDSLHATANIHRTLDHVKSLLAPGGLLVLVELTAAPAAIHLAFGMLKGWWLYEDGLRTDGPLLSTAGWKGVLTNHGFDEVAILSDRAEPETAMQNVIVARAPAADAKLSPVAPSHTGNERRIVVLSDERGVAAALSHLLVASGADCVVVERGDAFARLDARRFRVRPSSRDDFAALFAELDSAFHPTDVVHLWGADARAGDETTLDQFVGGQTLGALALLALVQAQLNGDRRRAATTWLVTCGGQTVAATETLDSPCQSAAWGLRRVFSAEQPDLTTHAIDLGAAPGDAELHALRDEILARPGEDEVAFRGRERYVARLFSAPEVGRSGEADAHEAHEGSRLISRQPGRLDSLALAKSPRREPGPGEVEISIAAAALNFRDVMKALGVYPTEGDEQLTLGDECSGTVVRVGLGVDSVAVGDEVVCVSQSAFSTFITVAARRVFAKPKGVPFHAAAGLPTVFATAEYALYDLARLAKGERILIHAAAGGVGLAAIQLAQARGAEVFATAGSEAKRAYLRALGVQHVFDSRTLAFADRVLALTDGVGVDVVLNSLSGDALRKSVSLLAPYGRFLEIGKRDIYGDTKLGLRPFRKNISFFAIDLGRLLEERPIESRDLFLRVLARFETGEVRALPARVYPVAEASSAFREMAQGKHIGKIVLSMDDARANHDDAPAEFRSDATYLISGGLGGFGLLVAEWMVDHGARFLVLLGRSGATTPASEATVARLRNAGAHVEIAKADVADEKALQRVLDSIRASMPPLRGVIHAAMAMDDVDIPNLTAERWSTVYRPKAVGGWNLHRLTRDIDLDFFQFFSSFTAIIGTSGQAAYAAANAALDAIAHHRRASGKRALSVNWGPLGEVGFVAGRKSVQANVLELGAALLTNRQVLAALTSISRQRRPQLGVAELDWPKWATTDPKTSALPRFGPVFMGKAKRGPARGADGRALRNQLNAAAPAERAAIMVSYLTDVVAAVLGTSSASVDTEAPITHLGFDSLMAVELNARLRTDTGVALATINLMRGPSVVNLSSILLEKLFAETKR